MVIAKLNSPICSALRKLIWKNILIGSNPNNADNPPIRANIAPILDAFSQYRPAIKTVIAPEK